jgi:hypothetical protein
MYFYERMKMAKSTTKNAPAEFDVEKIRRFTQQELVKLANNPTELPFCYQLGTDVLVGRYRVQKINDDCWRVMQGDQQLFDFFARKDAIFYCIALHKEKLQLANDIRDCDRLLNRLEFDASLYRLRYKKSQAKGDQWGEEFYSTRYKETMNRIESTKKEIKKNLNLAKYIKV